VSFYPSAAAARYIGLVIFSSCREKVTARPAGGQDKEKSLRFLIVELKSEIKIPHNNII